jgi:hypothetical protein
MTMTDDLMRRALGVTAVMNLLAAALFAFPASGVGQLAGLPAPVPPLYAALVALFTALFGGMYAWLARQPRVDRPMVVLAVVGKTSVVALAVAFFLAGVAPARLVGLAGADLAFAAIFAWWLFARREGPHEPLQKRA